MIRDLEELVERLRANPDVLALFCYGSRRVGDRSVGGDFDLIVFLTSRPAEVEGLHFYVGPLPVDLSVRALEDLAREEPVVWVDYCLADADVLFDRQGTVGSLVREALQRWPRQGSGLGEAAVAWERFGKTHSLDKVRGRLESHRLMCELVLAGHIHWLVRSYFELRGLPYLGEKDAAAWLREHDAEFHDGLEHFFAATALPEKLAIGEELTEHALTPVGGTWKRDEVLALGTHPGVEGLQEKGRDLFAKLFSLSERQP